MSCCAITRSSTYDRDEALKALRDQFGMLDIIGAGVDQPGREDILSAGSLTSRHTSVHARGADWRPRTEGRGRARARAKPSRAECRGHAAHVIPPADVQAHAVARDVRGRGVQRRRHWPRPHAGTPGSCGPDSRCGAPSRGRDCRAGGRSRRRRSLHIRAASRHQVGEIGLVARIMMVGLERGDQARRRRVQNARTPCPCRSSAARKRPMSSRTGSSVRRRTGAMQEARVNSWCP